jgi:hypothetical protein
MRSRSISWGWVVAIRSIRSSGSDSSGRKLAVVSVVSSRDGRTSASRSADRSSVTRSFSAALSAKWW